MRFKDKIPYEDVFVVPAVGNAANAAVAASRLGLKSALLSNVGDDYFGKEAIDALKKENVSTEFTLINAGKKTNYHYVLWYEDDRTILIKHEEYNYQLPYFDDPKWVYFSSIGENSLRFHETIEKYLVERPNIKLAFQPGTYQIKFGSKKLAGLYRRTDVFICNKEEAQRILELNEPDIKKLLAGIHALGPKVVSITDGPNGAYASDGSVMYFMPPYPDPKPPLERTGAGDAFGSGLVAGLIKGKNLREAALMGTINAEGVISAYGAKNHIFSSSEMAEALRKERLRPRHEVKAF